MDHSRFMHSPVGGHRVACKFRQLRRQLLLCGHKFPTHLGKFQGMRLPDHVARVESSTVAAPAVSGTQSRQPRLRAVSAVDLCRSDRWALAPRRSLMCISLTTCDGEYLSCGICHLCVLARFRSSARHIRSAGISSQPAACLSITHGARLPAARL